MSSPVQLVTDAVLEDTRQWMVIIVGIAILFFVHLVEPRPLDDRGYYFSLRLIPATNEGSYICNEKDN